MTLYPKMLAVLLPAAGCLIPAATAYAAFPELYLKPVVRQQFHSPTNILSVADTSRRIFVTDQPGGIFIVKNGMFMPVPFLDISAAAASEADRKVVLMDTGYSERGLLGHCCRLDWIRF
ncbi:MAG: hypothetical protein JWM59_2528 [Verrucomicrobiales bacterium]|nr:hypothetical protein [Verrucomicrobiales bacterium]